MNTGTGAFTLAAQRDPGFQQLRRRRRRDRLDEPFRRAPRRREPGHSRLAGCGSGARREARRLWLRRSFRHLGAEPADRRALALHLRAGSGMANPLWSPDGDELVYTTWDLSGLPQYEMRRRRADRSRAKRPCCSRSRPSTAGTHAGWPVAALRQQHLCLLAAAARRRKKTGAVPAPGRRAAVFPVLAGRSLGRLRQRCPGAVRGLRDLGPPIRPGSELPGLRRCFRNLRGRLRGRDHLPLEREAQLLAQLHHPNIASIFGLEESGRHAALVMELVDGPTLAERLEQEPFPFTESLSFALQIAAGARRGAREGDRPPRPQATEHKGFQRRRKSRSSTSGWPRRWIRLRSPLGTIRHCRGLPPTCGDCSGRTVRSATTATWRARGRGPYGRQAGRHLGVRRRALRDADRPFALRRRHGERHPGRGAQERDRLLAAACGDARCAAPAAAPLPRAQPEEPPALHRTRARATRCFAAGGNRGGADGRGSAALAHHAANRWLGRRAPRRGSRRWPRSWLRHDASHRGDGTATPGDLASRWSRGSEPAGLSALSSDGRTTVSPNRTKGLPTGNSFTDIVLPRYAPSHSAPTAELACARREPPRSGPVSRRGPSFGSARADWATTATSLPRHAAGSQVSAPAASHRRPARSTRGEQSHAPRPPGTLIVVVDANEICWRDRRQSARIVEAARLLRPARLSTSRRSLRQLRPERNGRELPLPADRRRRGVEDWTPSRPRHDRPPRETRPPTSQRTRSRLTSAAINATLLFVNASLGPGPIGART